jgi:hypothetical protein
MHARCGNRGCVRNSDRGAGHSAEIRHADTGNARQEQPENAIRPSASSASRCSLAPLRTRSDSRMPTALRPSGTRSRHRIPGPCRHERRRAANPFSVSHPRCGSGLWEAEAPNSQRRPYRSPYTERPPVRKGCGPADRTCCRPLGGSPVSCGPAARAASTEYGTRSGDAGGRYGGRSSWHTSPGDEMPQHVPHQLIPPLESLDSCCRCAIPSGLGS